GLARQQRGEFAEAIDALERSRAMTRERGTALEAEPFRLSFLGEAHSGLGEHERARELMQEGLQLARERGQAGAEMIITAALARVLLVSRGAAAADEVEALLRSGLEVVERTQAQAFEPFMRAELAELARQTGDEEGHQRELAEAHRLFIEVGAPARAERLAPQLATTSR
ncbi:MAG: hypothetical protein ACRDKX_04815, partial [Solirubrobacterales bacterium]